MSFMPDHTTRARFYKEFLTWFEASVDPAVQMAG